MQEVRVPEVVKIGTREVGPGSPTFIIAECGSNHGGSLDAALALIDAAADAGADAAKFQYFRVDRFLVARENPGSLRKYELPDAWLPKLKRKCGERGIEFLCTAFDLESLEVVDPFVNAHKVGSYEAKPMFVTAVTSKHKPIIISNGLSGATYLDDFYTQGVVTLKCVSKYPAPIEGYLREIPNTSYGQPTRWGVSDHTTDPFIVPQAAVALGACVVEKHFINVPHELTPDWKVSIIPQAFRDMARAIRLTESAVRG